MDRLRKAQVSALIVIGGLGVALAVALTSAGSFEALPEFFVVLTGIVIAAAVVALGKMLFEAAFLRIRALRRMILGRYDIEGAWFNVMRDEDGAPVGVGVSNFGYGRKGYFLDWSLAGEEYGLTETESGFELNLSRGFTFVDTLVGMAWPRLSYSFEATRSERAISDEVGYGYVEFSWKREAIARRAAGLSFGMGSDKPLEVSSHRLDSPDDAELVKQLGGPPGIAVKALGELWDRYGAVRRETATVVLGRKAEVEEPATQVIAEVEFSGEDREIVDYEEQWESSNGSSLSPRDN